MTKKHFIALADTIKDFQSCAVKGQATPFKQVHIDLLAGFCESQNPRFNRDRWLGYITGTNGKNGGKVN